MDGKDEAQKLTIAPTGGSADIWREAATILGYVVTSGRMAGKGNITRLIEAAASGEVGGVELDAALRRARREVFGPTEPPDIGLKA